MTAAKGLRAVLFLELVGDIFGGGQRSLLDLVMGLKGGELSPLVVCGQEGSLVEQMKQSGVPTWVVPMPTLFKPWAGGCRGAVATLKRLIADEGVALIHANQPRAALYALKATQSSHVPVVFHARVADEGGWLGRWVDWLLLRRCRVVVAISQAVAQRFGGEKTASRCLVIPNGVDMAWFDAPIDRAALRRKLGFGDEVRLIAMVGLLEPRKGHAVLFKALPRILEKEPKVHVVVAGRDAVNHTGFGEHLNRLVDRQGLRQHVTFLGFQEDVRPVFAAAYLCAMPVVEPEGLGRVAIEAAAMRCPLVTTALGGLSEVVEAGVTGLVVPPNDPAALAAALLRLLQDPALAQRLAAASRAKAEAHFSLKPMRQRIQQVYASVLQP